MFLSHPIVKLDVIDKRTSDGDGQVKAVGHQMKKLRSCRLTDGNLLPDVVKTETDTSRVHPAVSHGHQVVNTFTLNERKFH